jgi:hypothetical protein
MGNWRDKLSKARRDIHGEFAIPAVYLSTGTPVRIDARFHIGARRLENEFTWPNTPGFHEAEPQIVFDVRQVSKPKRKAFVFVSAVEVYRIGNPKPKRGFYMPCEAVVATSEEIDAALAPFDGEYGAEWEGILV